MDLSKIPRMSRTDPPPSEPGPQPPAHDPPPRPLPGAGPEAWISIAIGLIVLLMQRNLVTWLLSRLGLSDPPLPFRNPQTGQFDVPYEQTIHFFHDLGLGIFAIALIVEGIVLLVRNVTLMWLALGLMVLATGWNLVTVLRFYTDYGLQVMPALAVAFGVYIALHQWRVLQSIRPADYRSA